MKKKQQNIGIITKPIGKAGFGPLSNLVEIVSSFSDSTYVITGNEGMNLRKKEYQRVYIVGVPYKYWSNIGIRTINHIFMQLRISFKLIGLAKSVDIWIFFLDSQALLLPVITAKLMRKKIIFALAASIMKSAKAQKDTLANVLVYSEAINYKLSNRIILYSPNLIKEWNLEKYKNKICIAHEHFFDFDKFKIKKKFDARKNLVGYIGRLSEEKGVLNFVKAIPEIIKKRGDLEFLIGGDGQLRDKIKRYLEGENLNDKVKLPGWVPREEFLTYLNELKLFVLPSYTEGLPHTILEAMACGTPVLATPVGAIPDVIKDGETGFIMENNSPECIAENIVRALKHANLDEIVENARVLVEREFTYEAAVERYRKILKELPWP
ncbi:MAG: glycosyltransferase family 4 protein [Methanophagales archaeon]|nr:glycosyltransferase family 4 protein [Methanophagales archaeon]